MKKSLFIISSTLLLFFSSTLTSLAACCAAVNGDPNNTFCPTFNTYAACQQGGVPNGCEWTCTIPTTAPVPTTPQINCCQGPSSCQGIATFENCNSPCSWTCAVSTSCCSGSSASNNNLCSNAIGKSQTYASYLACVGMGCVWKSSCPVPKKPTPVPTRPVPRAFCKPPNGGPTNDPKAGGVWTNAGCIPYDSKSLATTFMTWGAGIGGGIAFLVLVYAAFLYVSSGGDPKKVQLAKELIVALLGGLALILFSVILLNYLGVNILGLQNFGFKG